MKSFTKFAAIVISFLCVTAAFAGSVWMTDFKLAKALAKKENKLILADFSGSDWCGWCIKLDKEVFSQAKFKTFAKKHFVLLMLDYPRGKSQAAALKRQNAELAQKYGVTGFPTVLLLDSNGKLKAKNGYMRGGPDAYIKFLQKYTEKKPTKPSSATKKSFWGSVWRMFF